MMTLRQLLELPPGQPAGPLEVHGLACDSRAVRPGHVFFALPGTRTDGHLFVDDALRRGAVAVVGEGAEAARFPVPYVKTPSARKSLADAACRLFDHPSRRLKVTGITGTNGKTTTTFLLRDILRHTGHRPGLIGTVQYEVGERCIRAGRTTPEAHELQALIAEMVRSDCDHAVMEVSSHGVVQERVRGMSFDVGVFTGLTRDHLDFHGTMEAYHEAKARFMRSVGADKEGAVAVVCTDDEWGHRLATDARMAAPVVTFGRDPAASVRAVDVMLSTSGARFRAVTPWGDASIDLKLAGSFNIDNALAALGAACSLGCGLDHAAAALSLARPAPGRMETIPNRHGLLVVVDYAHTDDALGKVLQAVRELVSGRLIVVFGCGGDRDPGKRPRMAEAAGRWSDFAVVTSDNPRTEDADAIFHDIEVGFEAGHRFVRIADRQAAIAYALRLATEGDGVVIAGKGHETYQDIGHTMKPFDDRLVVREVLGESARAEATGAECA